MTATTFFGFAIADSMFPANCTVTRTPLTLPDFVSVLSAGVASCCNGSHDATVAALNSILPEGVTVDIPSLPPVVKLEHGDTMIVMSVRGLPRLTDTRHYTPDEIAGATFVFAKWTVG